LRLNAPYSYVPHCALIIVFFLEIKFHLFPRQSQPVRKNCATQEKRSTSGKIDDLGKKITPYFVPWVVLICTVGTSIKQFSEIKHLCSKEYVMHDKYIPLKPPIKGDWIVIQGGMSDLWNHHRVSKSQFWALDIGPLLPLSKGQDLTMYAPCAGKILAFENKEVMGRFSPQRPMSEYGNYVFMQCNGFLNFELQMAHFQTDSVIVRVGEIVKAGQKIAIIGNTGNSTGTHLHIHAQETIDGKKVGVPINLNGAFLKAFDALSEAI
jgi:hypothetical protein